MRLEKIPDTVKHLSIVFLIAWLGRSTVWNFLPIYFERHIPSVFLVGILTSLPAMITIFIDIPVGNLVQRAGEKIVIFMGFLTAIFPGLFYLVTTPFFLTLGKIFEGISKSMVWIGGWSLSLKTPNEEVESESVSIFLVGVKIALVIGPIIGGYLIYSYGFFLPLYLWIIMVSISIFTFYVYIGISTQKTLFGSVENLLERQTYTDDFRHIRNNWSELKLPLNLIFLYSIIFSFFWLAVPLLLEEIGTDFITMGVIFGAAAFPSIFQYVFGDLADRYGDMKVIVTLALISTIILACMSTLHTILFIGITFLLARFFVSGMSPAIHALYDSKVPDDIEGEVTGFFELSKHVGQAIGPALAGLISSIWSLSASFLMASMVSVIIMIVSIVALVKGR